MFDWLLDPFASAITQRALIEVLVVALACGPLGVWVLLYGQSYAAESLSHAMLPGLVAVTLLGLPILLGAFAGVIIGAAIISLVSLSERLGRDIGGAIGIVALVGLGAVLALTPNAPVRLYELMFGNLLGISSRDLAIGGLLALTITAALIFSHRSLAIGVFDRASARALGIRRGRVELWLLLLLGAAIAIVAQGVGNLLLLALIVAPSTAALCLTTRLTRALLIAPIAVVSAGFAALILSYHLHIAAGAAVAGSAILIAFAVLAVTKRQGVTYS